MDKTFLVLGFRFLVIDVVAIRNPEQHVRKASHLGSKQQ